MTPTSPPPISRVRRRHGPVNPRTMNRQEFVAFVAGLGLDDALRFRKALVEAIARVDGQLAAPEPPASALDPAAWRAKAETARKLLSGRAWTVDRRVKELKRAGRAGQAADQPTCPEAMP